MASILSSSLFSCNSSYSLAKSTAERLDLSRVWLLFGFFFSSTLTESDLLIFDFGDIDKALYETETYPVIFESVSPIPLTRYGLLVVSELVLDRIVSNSGPLKDVFCFS